MKEIVGKMGKSTSAEKKDVWGKEKNVEGIGKESRKKIQLSGKKLWEFVGSLKCWGNNCRDRGKTERDRKIQVSEKKDNV